MTAASQVLEAETRVALMGVTDNGTHVQTLLTAFDGMLRDPLARTSCKPYFVSAMRSVAMHTKCKRAQGSEFGEPTQKLLCAALCSWRTARTTDKLTMMASTEMVGKYVDNLGPDYCKAMLPSSDEGAPEICGDH